MLPTLKASSEWSASDDLDASMDEFEVFREPLLTRSAMKPLNIEVCRLSSDPESVIESY